MVSESALSAFLIKATRCKSYPQLRSAILDTGNVVPSTVWGWTRFGTRMDVVDIAGHRAPDTFFEKYQRYGKTIDPILPIVASRHVPVHNLQASRNWDREQFYLECLRPLGWKHLITAPVVGEGGLVATLHYVRGISDKPFDGDDLLMASAMANHVSALLARTEEEDGACRLTERELEIGRLVAAGLNNAEIATCLGITRNTVKGALKRVFRKLDVDARAEMAVRLSAARLL
jgi:DNA-binding CsgD family transcriptional regulator